MKSPLHYRLLISAAKRQAGMTLMEIIAALAIIAAVVVGALALFNSAQGSNQAVTMLKDIIAIRSAVQQLYTGQGGYAAGLNTQLNNSRKSPSDLVFVNEENGFRTPWGGTLVVAPDANTARFTITLTAVPASVCAQLVTSASDGWASVSINGAAQNAFPVTPAIADANCQAGGTTIIWTTVN